MLEPPDNLESMKDGDVTAALAAVDARPDKNFWRHDQICEAAAQLIIDPASWWIHCFCRQRAWARCTRIDGQADG